VENIPVKELMWKGKLPKVMKEQQYPVQKQLLLAIVQDIAMADLWQPGEKHREHWLQMGTCQKDRD
jgi:hypothetical protein